MISNYCLIKLILYILMKTQYLLLKILSKIWFKFKDGSANAFGWIDTANVTD